MVWQANMARKDLLEGMFKPSGGSVSYAIRLKEGNNLNEQNVYSV